MPQPKDFGLDLATRIALHEMLLQKLFAEYVQQQPDPDAVLAKLLLSLDRSFDVENLSAGAPELTAAQAAQAIEQSAYGKELSDRFVRKVSAFVRGQPE